MGKPKFSRPPRLRGGGPDKNYQPNLCPNKVKPPLAPVVLEAKGACATPVVVYLAAAALGEALVVAPTAEVVVTAAGVLVVAAIGACACVGVIVTVGTAAFCNDTGINAVLTT